MGALLPLTDPLSWREFGALTPDECAAASLDIISQAYSPEAQLCPIETPAPFWDNAEDVDDSFPPDSEDWYGEVTNPTAPADELTFVENAAIWTFTGFVAYAAGIGAAIAYRTIAPRFVLAWKRGDLGEIIRVVIDAADYAEVDTSTVSEGEIITLNVLPDPDLETHDILLVKVG